MKKGLEGSKGVRGVCATLLVLCGVGLGRPSEARAQAQPDLVKKGEYLMRAGDCIACHTAPGGKPFAGGMYMKTPFGEISVPNITPDRETGIGAWSDEQFYQAVHQGIGHEGEYLYPVFPFPWYTKISRDDVLAIKAYLFSLNPEHAPRKPLKFGFPFNIRAALLTWRTAFFKAETFKPDPSQSAKLNRGAYLVEGLGHCGECHNHNNILGASGWAGKLEGGEIDGWYAPNITSDGKQGLGSWSEDDIALFLKTGAAHGKSVALGPMMETINDSLSHLDDGDLHAMAAYLKSLAAKQSVSNADSSKGLKVSLSGSQVYLSNCASCHQADGRGLPGMIPNLAGNGAVTSAGPQNVIRVVLGGLQASHGLAPMVAIGQDMSDDDISAAVNYVRSAWGNNAPENAGAGMVATLRQDTTTMLAGNNQGGCPAIAEPVLARAVAGVQDQLKEIQPATMLQTIDAVLPKIKEANPAITDEDLVNGLTIGYCPVVFSDASIAPVRRPIALGNFSGLVYGQIKKGNHPN